MIIGDQLNYFKINLRVKNNITLYGDEIIIADTSFATQLQLHRLKKSQPTGKYNVAKPGKHSGFRFHFSQ